MEQILLDPGEAEWKIWWEDMFDRETPPSVEVTGRGLVKGLIELWARYLLETLQPNGWEGFSRFWLWWKQGGKSIRIDGDREGATRLRKWAFGENKYTGGGYVEQGDRHLLEAVATTHARLVLADETSERILSMAREADDRNDFQARLLGLEVQPSEEQRRG